MLSVEILSGGESEGGSVEETVCQETQTPRAVSNSHGDVDKSVVRSSEISISMLIVRLPYTRGFINVFSKKATGFHRQAKLFELNLFKRTTFH